MFFKKSRAKIGGKYKWFPRAHVVGHPIGTDELARSIAQKCTVTPSDVYAVLHALPQEMAAFMESGHSVKLDGLGSFHYKLSCVGKGVDTPEEVSTKQIKSVRVQFIPARQKVNRRYIRSLIEKITFINIESGEESDPDEE